MKESRAWRKIGERVERLMAKSPLVDELSSGICYVLDMTGFVWTHGLTDVMETRIHAHMALYRKRIPCSWASKVDVPMCHAYPMGEDWEARLLAIYWMAEEAEEEGN